jgi:hypothetical protein
MGGRGSGRRPSYSGRATTEESLPLDIRRLQRAGVLPPGRAASWQWTVNDLVHASIQIRAEAWQVELVYTYTPNGRPAELVRQTVMLETTPCTLGGSRQWFCCPTCSRRVAVIYGRGRLFGCRRCKGLAYASQGEADDDRAARRAERIRRQLGWEPGILNGPGHKPKCMHWRTYWRLTTEHDALMAVSLEGVARRLGFVDRFLAEAKADRGW